MNTSGWRQVSDRVFEHGRCLGFHFLPTLLMLVLRMNDRSFFFFCDLNSHTLVSVLSSWV